MLPGMKVYELPQTGLEPRPARWRGCGRGGVLITRSAVHSLGPYFIRGHGYDGCLRHLPPEGPKQALNDRMLLVAKHRGINRGEPVHDGQCRELRLDGEPVLDGREMGIELRGHANALFVSPFRPAVRGPHFGGFCRRAERSGERERISRRYGGNLRKTALADPFAELFLRRADRGKQLYGIESPIRLAQTALDR